MRALNKYALLNASNTFCSCFKRFSSHFVYHPEKIAAELGKTFLK